MFAFSSTELAPSLLRLAIGLLVDLGVSFARLRARTWKEKRKNAMAEPKSACGIKGRAACPRFAVT